MKLLFLILRHPLHFIEFCRDSNRYLKDHPKEPSNNKPRISTTVYPDGYYTDCTAKDFNKWFEYIHRQLN